MPVWALLSTSCASAGTELSHAYRGWLDLEVLDGDEGPRLVVNSEPSLGSVHQQGNDAWSVQDVDCDGAPCEHDEQRPVAGAAVQAAPPWFEYRAPDDESVSKAEFSRKALYQAGSRESREMYALPGGMHVLAEVSAVLVAPLDLDVCHQAFYITARLLSEVSERSVDTLYL